MELWELKRLWEVNPEIIAWPVAAIMCIPLVVYCLKNFKRWAKERETLTRNQEIVASRLVVERYARRRQLLASEDKAPSDWFELGKLAYLDNDLQSYFQYTKKSAELSFSPAYRELYFAYINGFGTVKNLRESKAWLLRSAESGDYNSMYNVATAYIEGCGLQCNPLEGIAWLYVAEFKGHKQAAEKIKEAQAGLDTHLVLLVQDRAKAIAEMISIGHSTVDTVIFPPIYRPPVQTPGVAIPHSGNHRQLKGSGTGSVISPSGFILTAAHVVEDSGYLEVVTPEGKFPASVLSLDATNDVALIKVDRAFSNTIPLGRSGEVRLGASVSTIGFPNIDIQGLSPKVTNGLISGENGLQNDVRLWQISVPVQPGNSGGPLLDQKGRVVGIVVSQLNCHQAMEATGSIPQNVNYAIKASYFEPLLHFHKVDIANSYQDEPADFQEMVARSQKSVVLILVY